MLLLFTSIGCARLRFASNFALAPNLSPLNPLALEVERREGERLQEISLLETEKREIGGYLESRYRLLVLKPAGRFSAALDWVAYNDPERDDIERLLERFTRVAERQNILSGHVDAQDIDLGRAAGLLGSLRAWVPVAHPHYAH